MAETFKRIVLLCDGTWNRPDDRFPTHVAALQLAIPRQAADGTEQRVVYMPGVGTGKRHDTWIGKQWDRFVGGGLGLGLDRDLMRAYAELAAIWQPGDEVFIFGFSRGAYTARSLAGLIRNVGLVDPDQLPRDPDRAFTRLARLLRYYRTRSIDTHPRNPATYPKRFGWSPRVATSRAEAAWRKRTGLSEPPVFEIAYMGLWDTVGSLGVPRSWRVLAALYNDRFRFHDTRLTSMVRSGRHAVAVDERRRSFEPTLWSNISTLNRGLQTPDSPYQEMWFPGAHRVMGGGGGNDCLSSFPLLWVLEGAARAGLEVSEDFIDVARAACDPAGPLDPNTEPPGWFSRLFDALMPKDDRAPPELPVQLSSCVAERWARLGDAYRPRTLHPYTEWLDGVDDDAGPRADQPAA